MRKFFRHEDNKGSSTTRVKSLITNFVGSDRPADPPHVTIGIFRRAHEAIHAVFASLPSMASKHTVTFGMTLVVNVVGAEIIVCVAICCIEDTDEDAAADDDDNVSIVVQISSTFCLVTKS